jgi:hypothetical protein
MVCSSYRGALVEERKTRMAMSGDVSGRGSSGFGCHLIGRMGSSSFGDTSPIRPWDPCQHTAGYATSWYRGFSAIQLVNSGHQVYLVLQQ